MRRLVAALITIYQKSLSPDHGWFRHAHSYGVCRFHPTCSEYTRQAVLAHGTVKGLAAGTWRVLRCHPWSRGGYDPVVT